MVAVVLAAYAARFNVAAKAFTFFHVYNEIVSDTIAVMKSNLIGQRFAMLRVIERTTKSYPSGQKQTHWVCVCDCGNTATIRQCNIVSRGQISCGCQKGRLITEKKTRHGKTGTSIYYRWWNMLRRCEDPKVKSFQDYGARGITVCERWHLFDNFLTDMGEPPGPEYTLEREDNENGYSPDNCVWSTRIHQQRNTRANRFIMFGGETKTLAEWSEVLKIKSKTLAARIDVYGWSVEKSFTTPVIHWNTKA